MKLLTLFLTILPLSLYSQLLNHGNIEVGINASLYADYNVINHNSINNHAEVIARRDVINNSNILSGTPSALRFIGLEDALFLPGNSDFHKVSLEKQDADIFLKGELSLRNKLYFSGDTSKLILQDNDVNFKLNALSEGYNAENYIVADSTGFVKKSFSSVLNAWFYPLGDSIHYTPIFANLQGSSFNSMSNVKVNVRDSIHPKVNTDITLSRYWNVNQSSISNYTNNVTGYYILEDTIKNPVQMIGCAYDEQWYYENSAGSLPDTSISCTLLRDSMDFTANIGLGIISGKVFYRTPRLGTYSPLARVLITLYEIDELTRAKDANGNIVPTQITLADGSYKFENLLPGEYMVKQTQPSGYASISDYDWEHDGDIHDDNTVTDNKIGVTLHPLEHDRENNFHEEQRLRRLSTNTISTQNVEHNVSPLLRSRSNEFYVYPVPFVDVLYLNSKAHSDFRKIIVKSIDGATVKSINTNDNKIEVYDLTSGSYIIHIYDLNGNLILSQVIVKI